MSRVPSPPPSDLRAREQWDKRQASEARAEALQGLVTNLLERVSKVEKSKSEPPVGVASPPAPKSKMPWWASWVLALITTLGGGSGIAKLVMNSNEELRQNAQMQATLERVAGLAAENKTEIGGLKQREQKNAVRNEVAFAVIGAALEKEGYSARGLTNDQVDFASTKNAAKPVRAVDPSGRELEVPPAAPPPGVDP